jgi:RNA polymerase sigma-70 factor (ECF subfamily)
MPDDETRLIRSAQNGDEAAFAALYDRHYDAVYHYCYYRLRDVKLAEDVTSEVFVRMVDKLDTFKIRGRPLLAWLYTIARNLIIDTTRRRGRIAHLSLDRAKDRPSEGEGQVVAHVERRLQADCLAAALQYLTESQRRVILLKFVEGHTNAEAAKVLKKTEGAIKSLQHRALNALRRALEKERCYEA